MARAISRQGAQEYVLHDLLGSGGMAVLYRGTMVTPAGTRAVAIKRIADAGVSIEANRRLIAEGRLVFRLTHANICQVLDLAVNDQGTFLIMEYVDGVDLRRLISHSGKQPLDVASAVHVARETARALDYAHRRADEEGRALLLVHGDVTPQNILISLEGEVKLCDFGIARSFGTAAPGDELSRAGTPYFLAPEVFKEGFDHRADIFALGVTLYLALGGTPFESGIDPRRLARDRPEVHEELVAAIERATAARSSRFTTAGELEAELAAYLARRFPRFTPSVLAQVVRRAVPSSEIAPPDDESRRVSLASIARSDTEITMVDGRNPFQSRLPPEHTDSRPGTKPVQAPRARRPRLALWASLAFGLSGVGVYMRYEQRPKGVAELRLANTPPASTKLAGAGEEVREPLGTPAPNETARRERMGYLSVGAEPWGVVYVDGRRLASHTPAYRLLVPTGSHRVEIRSPDGTRRSSSKQVLVEARRAGVVSFQW